jgi:hypothetical protein
MTNIDYSRYTICYIVIIVYVFVLLVLAAIKVFGKPANVMRRYPPWITECPDYWDKVIENGKVYCKRNETNANGRKQCNAMQGNYNSGYNPPPQALFYTDGKEVQFNNSSLPDRCKWAKACDVYWEGISDVSCSDTRHFSQYAKPTPLSTS